MAAPKKTSEVPAEASAEVPVKTGGARERKLYLTADKSSVLFDIQIRGEVIYGQWGMKPGHVEFAVPSELTDGFELHWHFVSGNVVAAASE